MPKYTNVTTSSPFLVLLMLALCIANTIDRSLAGDTLLKKACSTDSYAPNSTYEANLNATFTSLATNATQGRGKTRFFNTSVVGYDHGRSNTVFGLYLCRGDDSNRDCQTCVPKAIQSLLQECPSRPVVATVWYVDCMVRYSNESIFGIMDHSLPLYMTNDGNITTNASVFNQLVGGVMHTLANDVATSSKKYGTKEANFTGFWTVYAEAQCTPDLSTTECLRCLTTANNYFPDCCSSSKGARVLNPSCYAAYELFPFYEITPSPSSSSSSPPQLPTSSKGRKRKSSSVTIALVALVAILVVQLSVCIYLMWSKGRKKLGDAEVLQQNQNQGNHIPSFNYNGEEFPNVESLQYDLKLLQIATNNFSDDNKLGEGGFGGVYKGILPNGQEIAVKRLSVCSNQGVEQFMNEVVFVAKLQHRNLVRLLGFCLAEYEKLLVYEYVPNKSLDFMLFDHGKQEGLDWPTRYKIISGIARGMLYLHEDSRLRIVHRDLKASNILLDADMNPKISDFGTARHFNVDESQANTSRVAGTFGYMAPEYLLNGEFSLKSDVYSFGVLVLEIVSGRKGTSFRQSRTGEQLLTYAWKHWTEGNPVEIVDPSLGDSYTRNKVIRCIQLGLLCVQGDAERRPTMASIAISLNSDTELPTPQQPGLFVCNQFEPGPIIKELETDESSSKSMHLSFCSESSTN
ncbi:cysteine-rich receptor-like protein kinase 25 [Chenopodium quinoa]|uniref:cysteine-rich receptor-like protein kinase 25 n=1 Tax=Chenopodium quinoa TaxID=63459 RepID=UPI000B773770|nr:cysteine-rich receptor-like protein kinase 25 [Chenopodium quinoa]